MATTTEKLSFKIDADSSKAVSNIEQLEETIQQLQDKLKSTDFGTAEFNRLQNEVISATKAMKEFELSIEALDSEQKAAEFGSFAAGIGDITTGAFGLANAMGLAGGSAEDSLNTLASGIAIANAFRGGIEGIISMQKLLKSSTIANTIATNGGTVAQKLFNIAVSLNPIMILVAAIVAAVAAFAIFGGGADDAKEKQEQLNSELENTSRAADDASAALDRMASRQQNQLDNTAKILSKERELLAAKSKRTAEEDKRLEFIDNKLNGIELDKFDATIKNSGKGIDDLANVVSKNFDLIEQSIDVTDIEDGVNDIDYSALIGKNNDLKGSFKDIMNAGFTPENINSQLANLEQLRKTVGNYQSTLASKKLKMGDAEAEEFEEVITNADKLAGNIDKIISKADNYNKALGDKSTTKNLQDQNQTLEEIQKKEEAAKKAAEARKRALEEQKRLKEQLLKLEQDIELLGIDDDEQRAVRAIEIRLENETKAVEGKTKVANDVRKKLEEKAQIEIADIRAEYQKKAAEKKAEEDKKAFEREEEQYALLNEIRENDQQREITALVAEYEEKYALAEGNVELEKALKEQQGKDIAAIEQHYRDEKAEKDKEAKEKQKEKEEEELKKLLNMYDAMQKIFATIRGEGNALGVDLMTNALGAISTFTQLASKEFDSLAEKIGAYTEAIGGVIQGFVNAFSEASKARYKENLDDLAASTQAEKDSLTTKYNEGLLSKDQYDKSITDLDKKSKAQELAIKKQAFESEKKSKIATATVAGITGAVSAFAGAMQLGPIAGPIVGGLLAGAVGVLTGMNIAKIKATKFEGGGGVAAVAANTPAPATVNQSTLFSTGGDTSSLVKSKETPKTELTVKADIDVKEFTDAQNRVQAQESRATN